MQAGVKLATIFKNSSFLVKYRSHVIRIPFIRFLDPENICFDTKIMIQHEVIAEISAFISFEGGHFAVIFDYSSFRVKYRSHVFRISFIRFLDPENICFDTKMMIQQ